MKGKLSFIDWFICQEISKLSGGIKVSFNYLDLGF